jgi:PadR family transcriptional regulator, regulatory protein PadR
MIVSKVDVAVLGCLAESPRHGYELLETMRARHMDRWAGVGKASVYQGLRRLEQAGLIAGKAQEGAAGPDRRVYRITKSGRARLDDGLEERFADDGSFETAAGVAMGFLHLLPPAVRRRAVRARTQVLHELMDAAHEAEDGIGKDAGAAVAMARAMLDRQVALAEAELAWLARSGPALSRLRHTPTVGWE